MGLDLQSLTAKDIIETLRGDVRACFRCRFWVEIRDDERAPRWGTCMRMSVSPFPGMIPVAEDPELGAMLQTHPRHFCREFEDS